MSQPCSRKSILLVSTTGAIFASVNAGDCLTGDGTVGDPIEITLDPTGLIDCGPQGLRYTGSGINSVAVTNCVSGDGTASTPIGLFIDSTGHLNCGVNGLYVSTDFTVSSDISTFISGVTSSGCVTGNGVDNPLVVTVDPAGSLECGPQGLRYIGASGGGLSTVSTSGCLAGSGSLADPLYITVDPTGLLNCGTNGLQFDGEGGPLILRQTSATGVIPTVLSNPVLKLTNASAQTVTDFTGAADQFLYIILDSNTTIQNNSNIKLDNSVNFAPSSGGTLTLYSDNGVWNEFARAVF